MFRIETIDDRAGNEVRIIGYCAINLFINAKTKEQPQKETDHVIESYNTVFEKVFVGHHLVEWALSSANILSRAF